MKGFSVWIALVCACICLLWQSSTCHAFVTPPLLRLWRHQIEVNTRSIRMMEGSRFKVTCDGSAASPGTDPRVRWYGPDKHWISNEGNSHRVHVERSSSRHYMRLHIRRLTLEDTGIYYCRGWMGQEHGWDVKLVKLIVESATCTEGAIACNNDVGCFTNSQICDGTQHCTDGSDEDEAVCYLRHPE